MTSDTPSDTTPPVPADAPVQKVDTEAQEDAAKVREESGGYD